MVWHTLNVRLLTFYYYVKLCLVLISYFGFVLCFALGFFLHASLASLSVTYKAGQGSVTGIALCQCKNV